MLKWILWVTLAWLPILTFFLMRNETKFKKNLVVGVTLPYEARSDETVLSVLKRFKRMNLFLNGLLFVLSFIFLFLDAVAALLTAWMIWLLFALLLPVLPYVHTNRVLKRLKSERGWRRLSSHRRTVDLAVISEAPKQLLRLFVPAMILSLLPLLWYRDGLVFCLTAALLICFFYLCCRYLQRNKSEQVDDQVAVTRALTRIRRRAWIQVWLVCAYSFAVLSLIFSLFTTKPHLQLLLAAWVFLLMILIPLRIEFKTRRLQAQLTADSGQGYYVDEDDNWLGGLIYYNPDDERLLVNARVGVNSTVNLARPAGKVLAMILLLLLLSMPFIGPMLGAVENQPISLELTASDVIAHRGSKQIVLEREKIQSVTRLDRLPDNLRRVYGNAMETQLSGSYTAEGLGRLTVSLDPRVSPFLLLQLDDGTQYLVGSRQTGEAQTVYAALTQAQEQEQAQARQARD